MMGIARLLLIIGTLLHHYTFTSEFSLTQPGTSKQDIQNTNEIDDILGLTDKNRLADALSYAEDETQVRLPETLEEADSSSYPAKYLPLDQPQYESSPEEQDPYVDRFSYGLINRLLENEDNEANGDGERDLDIGSSFAPYRENYGRNFENRNRGSYSPEPNTEESVSEVPVEQEEIEEMLKPSAEVKLDEKNPTDISLKPVDKKSLENINTAPVNERFPKDKKSPPFSLVGGNKLSPESDIPDDLSEKMPTDTQNKSDQDENRVTNLSDIEIESMLQDNSNPNKNSDDDNSQLDSLDIKTNEINNSNGADEFETDENLAENPLITSNAKMPLEDVDELLQNRRSQGGIETRLHKRSNSKRHKREDSYDAVDKERENVLDKEYIKAYLELEDEENSNLAKALSLATKSQLGVSRNEPFYGFRKDDRETSSSEIVPEEIAYIRAAIEDERAIQQLNKARNGGNNQQQDKEDVQDNNDLPKYQSRLVEEKRLRNDLGDEFVLTNEEERDAYDSAMRRFLALKLSSYLQKLDGEDNLADLANELEKEKEQNYRLTIDPEEQKGRREELELNPFIRKLWEKYRKTHTLQKRYFEDPYIETDKANSGRFELPFITSKSDEDSERNEIRQKTAVPNSLLLGRSQSGHRKSTDERAPMNLIGRCPVEVMTDKCAFARRMGLDMDDEAMELCDRHKICYACGSVFGIGSEACDSGYLSDTSQLCGSRDTNCRDDAAGLYLLMLKHHRYRAARQADFACQARCVEDYILGSPTSVA